jgi:DNA-directed RNA polymerase omega subunit
MSSDEKPNKYRDVLITARRARQLQGGAQPMIDTRSTKACRVAQDEMAAGKVSAESVKYGRQQEPRIVAAQEHATGEAAPMTVDEEHQS